MPIFIAAIGGMLIQICGHLAGRVLVALGISVVTYTGINATLSWLKTNAVSAFYGLPPEVYGMLAMMRVGQCISIVTSAIVARAVINGLTGDTVKRWVFK